MNQSTRKRTLAILGLLHLLHMCRDGLQIVWVKELRELSFTKGLQALQGVAGQLGILTVEKNVCPFLQIVDVNPVQRRLDYLVGKTLTILKQFLVYSTFGNVAVALGPTS